MKTNKYFFSAIGFLTGLIMGISILVFSAFTNGPKPSVTGSGVSPVTATDANKFVKNYLAGAANFNQVIKGFTIDRTQLDAMNKIIQENTGLTGFRIYFGTDNNSHKIALVVGVDNNGNDAVNNTIYNTDSHLTNPCPPICDVNSTITKQ